MLSAVASPISIQLSGCKKSVAIVSFWYSLTLSAVRAVLRLPCSFHTPSALPRTGPTFMRDFLELFAPRAWRPIPRTYMFGLPGPPTTHMMGLRQQAMVSPPLGHPATPTCLKPPDCLAHAPSWALEGCPSACLLTPRHGHM